MTTDKFTDDEIAMMAETLMEQLDRDGISIEEGGIKMTEFFEGISSPEQQARVSMKMVYDELNKYAIGTNDEYTDDEIAEMAREQMARMESGEDMTPLSEFFRGISSIDQQMRVCNRLINEVIKKEADSDDE